MYYKLKKDDVIIDAFEEIQYVRYFPASRRILRCRESDEPMGVITSNGANIYHVDGWPEFPAGEYETVTMEGFDDPERYQEIIDAIRAEEDYSDFEEPEEEEEEEEIAADPTPMERLAALEAMIAGSTASYTADKGIESGEIFQLGGKIYKATSAIATGETIVPGSNCTETTAAELINELTKEA